VVPDNVHELDRIADYAEEKELFTIISPCIITANRFENRDRENDLQFGRGEREALLRFYASPRFAWSGHRRALVHYLRTGSMAKPCSAGFNTLFIRHSGEVFPCPVIAASLGNIESSPLEALFRSRSADRFRQRVGSFPECRICTEPGMERLALPLEGFSLLKVLAKGGAEDFGRVLAHMGLNKYLQDRT
jgi:MoaA/NifB/PqqE/SkfB family radical SAM enzyme